MENTSDEKIKDCQEKRRDMVTVREVDEKEQDDICNVNLVVTLDENADFWEVLWEKSKEIGQKGNYSGVVRHILLNAINDMMYTSDDPDY